MIERVTVLIEEVRNRRPLIHHLTNYVTINDCANITLAIGASPIMAEYIGEVREITGISQALVINIGTLTDCMVESMLASGKRANEMDLPVVLDPDGVERSEFRRQTVKRLLEEIHFSVIRGNMVEINCIARLEAATDAESGETIVLKLAEKYGCTVAVTGAVDVISDGVRIVCIQNGHETLRSIAGTGCMCSSLIGSFSGVTEDYFSATLAGVMCMGIAGELAYEAVGYRGNGSFHVAVIDGVSLIDADTPHRMGRVCEVTDFKAAIFDLDGTLLDSMHVWKHIDEEFLAKRNISLPVAYFDDICGLSFRETAEYTIRRFNLDETVEDLIAEWHDMVEQEYSNRIRLKPHAEEYLRRLKECGIRLGIATSLTVELLEPALKNNGIYELFDAVCSTNENGRGKEFPDIYILASEKLNVPACECVVFEDLLAGVRSAKQAGMKVYGIYDESSRDYKEEITELADGYFYDFRDAPIPVVAQYSSF